MQNYFTLLCFLEAYHQFFVAGLRNTSKKRHSSILGTQIFYTPSADALLLVNK